MIDKVLVTGGAGFLGSHFLPFFIKKHPRAELVVVIHKNKQLSGLNKQEISIVLGDLMDLSTWSRIPSGITHAIHLAASVPVNTREKNNPSFFEKNFIPVRHLARTAKKWPLLKQIIFASSVSVYTPSAKKLTEKDRPAPKGAYASAKLAGEEFLKENAPKKCRVTCFRFSSIFGPGQFPGTVLPKMIADAKKDKKIHIYGAGKRMQDFIFVKDAARLVERAYSKNTHGTFNAGSGTPVSMLELASKINTIFTRGNSKVIFHPGLNEQAGHCISIRKAAKVLDFSPVSLESGLRSMKQEGRR